MPGALAASLELAFDRIDDFVAVQRPLSIEDLGPVCASGRRRASAITSARPGTAHWQLASSEQAAASRSAS